MSAISIRFPEPRDAAALHEAMRESLSELLPWMGWIHPGHGLDDVRAWIARQPEARAEGSAFDFLLEDGEGRVLGACGINQVNAGHRFANLGYWVRTSAAGRGIAAEAVRLLERWVWEHTDLERLEILVAPHNARSLRVAEKAGAVREGVLRSRLQVRGERQDAVMFSLVRPAGLAPQAGAGSPSAASPR